MGLFAIWAGSYAYYLYLLSCWLRRFWALLILAICPRNSPMCSNPSSLMFNRYVSLAFLGWMAAASGALAQSDEPMSAIDWLSDSISDPPPAIEPGVSDGAGVEEVRVVPLERSHSAGIGLISPNAAGVPADLWGASRSDAVARAIVQLPETLLPTLQTTLKQILIARLIPPADVVEEETSSIYRARIDRLLSKGALDEARALLIAADTDQPDVFRRWFDVALLLGEENTACRVMRTNPDILPTYPARIFCLARNGDWDVAALTLGTAEALGLLTPDEDILLAGFLDPAILEEEVLPPPPVRLTPLDFRLYEAVGERLQTTTLPLAFARADLSRDNGWKIRLTAAERLTASGALSSGELFALYRERDPSASGGIWERVEAVQALDRALATNGDIAAALEDVWSRFSARGLESALAEEYAPRIALLPAPLSETEIKVLHLAGQTTGLGDLLPDAAFREGLLNGQMPAPFDAVSRAIADGFARSTPPTRLAGLIEAGRSGEALLRAMALLSDGANGDLASISDGIATLRLLGFEAHARQASVELLLQDRRG